MTPGDQSAGPVEQDKAGPRVSLCTSSVRPADRFDFWRDLNQPGFEMFPVDEPAPALDASVSVWEAGALSIADMRFLPGERHRFRIDIGGIDTDTLVVRYFRKGGQHGLLNGEPVTFGTGEVHIYPYGSEFVSLTGDLEQVSAYLPFDQVGFDPGRDRHHRFFGSATPTGRKLIQALATTIDDIGAGCADHAIGSTETFCAIVHDVLDRERRGSHERRMHNLARSHALRAYVRTHLNDPDLNSTQVCEAFAASRATIYREFEADGGIYSYILTQRLRSAMLCLVKGPVARGDIGRVALSHGFRDTGHFSRTFRQAYGTNASDFIGAGDAQADPATGDARQNGEAPWIGAERLVTWFCRP